jgi:hypothetical protein
MKIYLTFIILALAAFETNAAVYTNTPSDKDAFVRALAPNSNYGGGGALSVSGTNATVNNPTNGAFDSFISFNTAAMVSNFNSTFGGGNWTVTGASLALTQNPVPGNPVFNSGNGNFQIRWLANDTWTEGSGNPNAPTTNGITYAQENNYLNSNRDLNLGVFDFTGASPISCPLALPATFVTNMQAGGEVGFFLTAVDPSIGFVFYSRSFAGNPSVLPKLIVTAAAQPVISGIQTSGADLIISAANGVSNGTYFTLSTTDLSQPVQQWTPVQTNVLAAGGNFTVHLTNAAAMGPLRYFILAAQ